MADNGHAMADNSHVMADNGHDDERRLLGAFCLSNMTRAQMHANIPGVKWSTPLLRFKNGGEWVRRG